MKKEIDVVGENMKFIERINLASDRTPMMIHEHSGCNRIFIGYKFEGVNAQLGEEGNFGLHSSMKGHKLDFDFYGGIIHPRGKIEREDGGVFGGLESTTGPIHAIFLVPNSLEVITGLAVGNLQIMARLSEMGHWNKGAKIENLYDLTLKISELEYKKAIVNGHL